MITKDSDNQYITNETLYTNIIYNHSGGRDLNSFRYSKHNNKLDVCWKIKPAFSIVSSNAVSNRNHHIPWDFSLSFLVQRPSQKVSEVIVREGECREVLSCMTIVHRNWEGLKPAIVEKRSNMLLTNLVELSIWIVALMCLFCNKCRWHVLEDISVWHNSWQRSWITSGHGF